MRRGRIWLLALTALVLMAVGNWWLADRRQPAALPAAAGEKRINYALSEFKADFFDRQGTHTLHIAGPRFEHDANTREAVIREPRFIIDPTTAAWRGKAEHGRLERDSEALELLGAVRIEKPEPAGTVTIETERLRYDRRAAIARSPVTASVAQGGNLLVGGTLTLWIDDERMEFENDVHAVYRAGAVAAERRAERAARD